MFYSQLSTNMVETQIDPSGEPSKQPSFSVTFDK